LTGHSPTGWSDGIGWASYADTVAGFIAMDAVITPSAGSHLIGIAWKVSLGTGTMFSGTSDRPVSFQVEEVLRPNTDNS
jgi:hypothetical protein